MVLAALGGCSGDPAAPACAGTVVQWPRDQVIARALRAVDYGQQFVVTCAADERSRLRYTGPACAEVAGLSPGLHRDLWSANYLNHDDPAEPTGAALLGGQRHVTVMLADPAAYKALALLRAHALTGDVTYLDRFRRLFLPALLGKQDASGGFAHAVAIDAGADGRLGTDDDVTERRAGGEATFHTAVVLDALAAHEALATMTADPAIAAALHAGGLFLAGAQRADGSFAYPVPPSQAPADALSTALCGATLSRLARLALPDQARFEAAARHAATWAIARGAETADRVSAGSEIELLLAVGEREAARAVGDRLLAWMVTPRACGWGRPAGEDPHALGGVNDGNDRFQSPWYSTYSVPGLLALHRATGDARYRAGADLMVGWLFDKLAMARDEPVPIQDLAGDLAVVNGGGAFGLVPEVYELGSGDDTRAGRVLGWVGAGGAASADRSLRPPSVLETAAGLDREALLYDHVRSDPYWARVTHHYPWRGGPEGGLPANLGEVSTGLNPLVSDDAALALLAYALGRSP